jgi:hypothetical protein
MATIRTSAQTTKSLRSNEFADIGDGTSGVELGVLFLFFVGLVGFGMKHVDIALAGFSALVGH